MSKRSILILTIILVVVIVGGGVFVFGANKGWFGSSADVISLISRGPTPTVSKTNSPTVTAKPAYGSIAGTILEKNKTFYGDCDVFLGDGGGGGLIYSMSTTNGLFGFNNLFPGSNYMITVTCINPPETGLRYLGMKGPIKVVANQVTNVKVSVRIIDK